MPNPFPPPAPAPAQYGTVTPGSRCGIFYGPTPSPTFTLGVAGANAYTVRDYTGTVVSTGAVTGTTVTPAAPSGGWKYGWHRLYLTGPTNDPTWGTTAGAYNFNIVRNDSRFVPNPAISVDGGTNNGAADDEVTRGVFVMGPQRWAVADATNPAASITEIQTGVAIDKTYYSASGYLDSNRSRPLLVSFPNGAVDGLSMGSVLRFYCKDGTVNGATTFVQISTGTSTGFKVQVFSPNSTTLVETFDNLSGDTAIASYSKRSAYVRAYANGSGSVTVAGPTAIGTAAKTGVGTVVSTLYPDVTWFEGPSNEPTVKGDEIAQQMLLFNANVKAGNASAKVLGPQLVSASLSQTVAGGVWDLFLSSGGAASCDGISFHGYSMLLGDLNMMRANLAAFTALLAKYGVSKPLWQTEQGVFTPVSSVYHPRRARWSILQILVQESYGITKEQNHLWYDKSHGFWAQPTWWENGDNSLNPQPNLLRVMSEELFGTNWLSALNFGNGNSMYFGGLWRNPTDNTRVAVVIAASAGLGNVTLTVTGATGALTYCDAWGNTGTVTVTGGQVTLPTTELPTYLRLPAAASVAPYSFGSWPAIASQVGNIATSYTKDALTQTTVLGDGLFQNSYDGGGSPYSDGAALPNTVTFGFAAPQRFDRVVIWSGQAWQSQAALVDFDVQTSPDKITWTTRATVTQAPPATLSFWTGAEGVGCTLETYWDERYIFDVKLAAVVTAQYVRLNVRATSYGGEPDATCLAAGGQGSNPAIVVQELGVFSDDQAQIPRWVTH